MEALTYINHGRALIDCPSGCGNAYQVGLGESSRVCDWPGSGCGAFFTISTDDNFMGVLEELNTRTNKRNRNWFPAGHPLAVKAGLPHGQTVEDLRVEAGVYDGVD